MRNHISAKFCARSIFVTSLLVGGYWCITPPSFIRTLDSPSSTVLLSESITAISALGGVSVAVYFLTAQIRPLGVGNAAIGVLYRDITPYATLIAVTVSLIFSFVGSIPGISPQIQQRIIVVSLVSSGYVVLSLIPLCVGQLENMDKTILANKVLADFTAVSATKYGLVKIVRKEPGDIEVQLETNGLNYERHDPLRAFHELVEQAILERDRLLLGRLLGCLFHRSCQLLYLKWPGESVDVEKWDSGRLVRSHVFKIRDDNLASVIHQLHYVVRLARKTHKEWPELDVGRHSVQYQLSKLITSMARVPETYLVCMTTISALMRISETYAKVKPYGRVEPLNSLGAALRALQSHGRSHEESYLLDCIAVIMVRTKQLEGDRGRPLLNSLSTDHRDKLTLRMESVAATDDQWPVILPSFDPWG